MAEAALLHDRANVRRLCETGERVANKGMLAPASAKVLEEDSLQDFQYATGAVSLLEPLARPSGRPSPQRVQRGVSSGQLISCGAEEELRGTWAELCPHNVSRLGDVTHVEGRARATHDR